MTPTTTGKYKPPVSILATGASTAVGYCAPTTAASVKAGISRIAQHPFMVDSRGNAYITAHAKYLPDIMDGNERLWQLGLSAANEALGAVQQPPFGTTQIPVIIGLPGIRPGFSAKAAESIKTRFQEITHPLFKFASIEILCCGNSAGLMALEKGCAIISQGIAPLCLAGGMDSWINADDLEWLDAQGMLHGESNAWGCIPGEGAGFCLLSSEKVAKALGMPAVAQILASATSFEKNLINTEAVCTGEGLSRAIELATAGLSSARSGKIDSIICDLNGLRYRADEFGFALVKNGRRFKSPENFMAPADYWGDVGAASGPLFVSLAAHSDGKDRPEGQRNLVITGSDTGERAAMVVKTLMPRGKG